MNVDGTGCRDGLRRAWTALVPVLVPFGLLALAGQATAAGQDDPGAQGAAEQAPLARMAGSGGRAFVYFCQAALSGRPIADFQLGWMYLKGRGAPSDPARAGYWFARAARSGDSEAAALIRRNELPIADGDPDCPPRRGSASAARAEPASPSVSSASPGVDSPRTAAGERGVRSDATPTPNPARTQTNAQTHTPAPARTPGRKPPDAASPAQVRVETPADSRRPDSASPDSLGPDSASPPRSDSKTASADKPPARRTTVIVPKPERACVRAYHRDTRTRGAIKTWLSERGVEPRTVRVEVPYGTIFQVYREPLGTAEVARAELERLKARGIRDALVIRTGVLKHGIALGAYRREADARNRVAELGSQGVVAGFRTQNPTRRQDWLRFRIGAEERARLEADFSGLKLEPAEGCARP